MLYEKNADEVLYPASITKIMTALLGCEYGEGKYDEIVTHSENAINGIGYGSSTMGMQVGEQITLEDCLYGIMMCSANEACMALAEHVSGSVDEFVNMMNERAEKLGCTNTHFANPHGFHDPNHYTTARDMALITEEAVKNEKFSEIWGTMLRTLPATNLVSEPRGLVNRAKILDDESQYYYPYIIGAKTGFHDDALNTLVACAEKDGAKIISVVMKDLGAPLAYADTKTLLDYGFTQYANAELYNGEDFSQSIPVVQTYNGTEYSLGSVNAVVKGSFEKMVPTPINNESISVEPELNEKLEAPVNEGDVVGKMIISYDSTEIGEMDIVAASSVEKLSDNELSKRELIANVKYYGIKAAKYACVGIAAIIVLIILIRIIRRIFRGKKKKRKKRSSKNKNLKQKGKTSQNTQKRKKHPEQAQGRKRRPDGGAKRPSSSSKKRPASSADRRPVQRKKRPVKKAPVESEQQ